MSLCVQVWGWVSRSSVLVKGTRLEPTADRVGAEGGWLFFFIMGKLPPSLKGEAGVLGGPREVGRERCLCGVG